MEFQEFCKQHKRICEKHSCCNCPLNEIQLKSSTCICLNGCMEYPDEAERIVSEWVKEHPVVTNADKFREVFGVSIGSFGAPCPDALTIYGIGIIRNQEWLAQEYKPPRKEEINETD